MLLFAAAAAASFGVYWFFWSDLGLRAPFTGLVLGFVACALIAIGYVGRSAVAVVVAVLAVELVLGMDELVKGPAPDGTSPGISDDPGGLPAGAAMLILLPVPLVLASAGWAMGAVVDRLRRRRGVEP